VELLSALQLYSEDKWVDLMDSSPLTIYLGTRRDLIAHLGSSQPALQQLAAILERTEHPAASVRFVNSSAPEQNAAYIALSSDLGTLTTQLTQMSSFGCQQDTLVVGSFFYAAIHEMGHIVHGILGQKIGMARALSSNPSTLIPVLIEEEVEEAGTCESNWNLPEYLPESLSRELLCRYSPETVYGQWSVGDVRTYTPPRLEDSRWGRLRGSLQTFFDLEGIDPSPFIECELSIPE
jgi:hypothetical protein